MDTICEKCGEKIGFFERSGYGYQIMKFCDLCYENFKKALKDPTIKTCNKCANFKETIHACGGVDSWGAFVDESYTTCSCGKFDFGLPVTDYYNAEKCSSYFSKQDYKEKCISGEFEKDKQVMKEWECGYCKTINAGKFCSNCGSPKKREQNQPSQVKTISEEPKTESETKPSWYIEALKQHSVPLY